MAHCLTSPAAVLGVARLFLAARVGGDKAEEVRLRTTVNVLLENPGCVGAPGSGPVEGETEEEKSERLRAAMHEAVDFFFGL